MWGTKCQPAVGFPQPDEARRDCYEAPGRLFTLSIDLQIFYTIKLFII